MRCYQLFAILIILVFITACSTRGLEITESGKSKYKIVIRENASEIEKRAAEELSTYIVKISGAEIPIVTDINEENDHEILIGESGRILESMMMSLEGIDEDGFIIHTIGKKLIIIGGEEKGTLYGVYTFLEDYLGCRMYSPNVQVIPQNVTIAIPEISVKQEPAFAFRELHMPLPRESEYYRDWHKLDFKEGKNEWGMFVHTFDDFIPAEKYFKTNPEYFSYLNVQRIPDGQLCLSNPEVYHIIVEDLKDRMKEKPGVKYWSVSQNDTYKACECDNCKKEYEIYDGYSGAMVHFVNRVAEQFPDKIISTLAYQYTRPAPTRIKPLDNVNIMFCSIECNRSKALALDPSSVSFVKDTRDWCNLTGNIFMWDYVVQFRNLLSPFPNLRVLQPNIQFFRDNGIEMMFQQGSGGLMSEFVELRSYLIAKLLWNPDLDMNILMDDFLTGYYGPAGKRIRKYIDTMHDALEQTDGSLGIYGYPYDGIKTYLTPELIKVYEQILDEAKASVEDKPAYLNRVEIASLPLEFAILDISLRNVNDELSYFKKEEEIWVVREDMLHRLATFTEAAKDAGVNRYWEHGNYPDEYYETVKRYATTSMKPHLAMNKTVMLENEASPKYPVGGAAALTDGLIGINDYHFNWLGFEGPDMVATIDLGENKKIAQINAGFLQEIKSWVFLPEFVQLSISEDGVSFKNIANIVNTIPEKKEGTFTHAFEMKFEPVQTRFVKITAKNKGECPMWHPGAGNPSWIFCDEISVN
jgi:hypothetical protein